ncbi:acyltransferase [Gaetbulibacter sp. M240]|uniref:acyltransferase family protein n=1 Tax=Gaetbulibacter sp. M240 TaxID=3126511 RepID=UPI00374E3C0A
MENLKNSFSNLFNRPEQNYKAIDGIRAIAILWVIILHVWFFQLNVFPETTQSIADFPLLAWITRGDLGVDLFFVISGFLIGTILFKEFKKSSKINFKKFYTRRFFRLIPVYIFSMILGIYFLKGTPLHNWQDAWINLLYINNYVTGSYVPWTWSLAIEEQFYIVTPFLIAFIFPLFKRKYLLFLISAIIPIALTYYYSTDIFDFSVPFNNPYPSEGWLTWFWDYYMLTHLRYGGLLAGIISAYLNVYYSDKVHEFFTSKRTLSTILIVVSLVVFFFISNIKLGQSIALDHSIFYDLPAWVGTWYEVLHREVFCYAVAYLIMACIYSDSFAIKPVNRFLSLKFFYPIAQISYSAYLFSEMLMIWYYPRAAEFFEGSTLADWEIIVLNGAITIVIILIVSSLMYIFIEQPFQHLRNKLTMKVVKVKVN